MYVSEPPVDHITEFQSSSRPVPSKPSYGLDSPLGLVLSNVLAPLYLYSSLKGKFDVWDNLLADIPSETITAPTLDIGCGRGLVLLKIAQLKKNLSEFSSQLLSSPAYGVDLFIKRDQTGNSPEATYDNAAALGVVDQVVLHTADFARLPFQDMTFSLVTASLSIHNADKTARRQAIVEAARVVRSGGYLLILDLMGYVGGYGIILESLGWSDVETKLGGMKVMFGAWPCQILKARKS
jgi:SAM-dependent methyltransferase